MPSATPTELLRPGLLAGVRLLLIAAGDSELADTLAEGCRELGASLARQPAGEGDAAEQELPRALDALGGLDALAIDAASLYASAGRDGREAMRACLQQTWEATRALANAAFIEPAHPGRILFIAPSEDDEYARAARAGLENLARTLSIEWSRHPVTTVAIAPSAHTGAPELAALLAYLCSPAGAYFSGCLLDLRGNPSASRASERAAKKPDR